MATLAELVAQAQKKPYPLTLLDGTAAGEIAHPSLEAWMGAPTDGTTEAWLLGLGVDGKTAAKVDADVAAAPLGTSDLFFKDVARHFGRGN